MSKKPRVLLVCYYFPPLGGAGVGRPLSLFKRLPDFGFDCEVLTVKPVAYRGYDESLLEGLDASLIHRAGSFDPQRLMRLIGLKEVKPSVANRGRAASRRFFPDNKVGWIRKAVREGRTLLSNRSFDAILSTSPPISVHKVALRLSRDFSVPWIADFRDFWNSYPPEDMFDDPRLVRRAYELMNEISVYAAGTTAINQPLADWVGDARVIHNSYDEDAVSRWTNEVDHENFTIGLFGEFSAIKPVAPLGELLAGLRSQSPELFARMRLQQIGMSDREWLRSELKQYDVDELCEYHGFLPRMESIETASRCAAFYVAVASERERAFTTSRIYYLLASGRPLIASAPVDSEIARLVNAGEQGISYLPEDPAVAITYLETLIEEWRQGTLSISPEPEYSRQFASEYMVRAFADTIKEALGQ